MSIDTSNSTNGQSVDERMEKALAGMALLIDKDAILDCMLRTGYAADRRDWDEFFDATTEDLEVQLWLRDQLVVHTTNRDGFHGGVGDRGAYVRLHGYPGPFQTTITGDTAHSRFNPEMVVGVEGTPEQSIAYADVDFRRTPDGWKVAKIVFRYLWHYEHMFRHMEPEKAAKLAAAAATDFGQENWAEGK